MDVTEQLKMMKDAPCCFPGCSQKSAMTCSVPMAAITESGQLIYPEETRDSSVGLGIPLCGYHMHFAFRGLVAATKDTVFAPSLKIKINGEEGLMEDLSDEELKKLVAKFKKDKTPDGKFWKDVVESVLEGRKFLKLAREEKLKWQKDN